MSMLNYYEILDVTREASEEDIKRSYRRLALLYHPDKNRDDSPEEAARKFREISEAYEVLSDQRKRQQYDLQFRDSERQRFPVGDFAFRNPFDIFQEFFGMRMFGSSFDGSFLNIGAPNLNQLNLYQRTSVNQSFINGVVTETRVYQSNNEEIIETYENGMLKSRQINGVQQAIL